LSIDQVQLVGREGFEPSTPRLSSVCSNQLSYRPKRPTPRAARARRSRQGISSSAGQGPARGRLRERETRTAISRLFRRSSGESRSRHILRDFDRTVGRGFLRRANRRPEEIILRKEVIQPQVPLRLPCYDFTPVIDPTVVSCLLAVSALPSGRTNSHGVTGGVYKARERIHRSVLICDY
jgi:hypothetical protein